MTQPPPVPVSGSPTTSGAARSGLWRWYREALFDRASVELYHLADDYTAESARLIALELGLFAALEHAQPLEPVLDQLGIVAEARPMVRRVIQILCYERVGTTQGDGVRLEPCERLYDLDELRERGLRADDAMQPAFEIVDKVREHALAFAQGRTTADEVRSRVHIDFFLSCPLGTQTSALGGGMIRHIFETHPSTHWSVLELGGGTMSGAIGTLDALSEAALADRIEQFHFTEINPYFVMQAREALPLRYPQVRKFRCSVANFNEPLAKVEARSVDLLYGVNCLQCARDLPFTLSEIRRVLRPGGWLVIPQYTRGADHLPVPLVDLVCDPLPSYWDVELIPGSRPVYGMPTAASWAAVLETAGFVSFEAFPERAAGVEWFDERYYCAVIVARRPS